MSFPSGCYSRAPNLRVRPIEEMKSCAVFRPSPPKMFMLNLNAWLIFELCDGSSLQQLEQRYRQEIAARMPPAEAQRMLMMGLEKLCEQGLVQLKSMDE